MKQLFTILLAVACIFSFSTVDAVQYIDAPPLSKVIKTKLGSVSDSGTLNVPLITWGGDIATILANGNSLTTKSGSIFNQKGLNMILERQDDFKKQVENFISGKTPLLRCTAGMLNMAIEAISKYPETKPYHLYQETWSTGGDCIVVKKHIKTVKDLKGKVIAVQAYGPHVDYLTTLLRDAGLSMSDVTIKWVKDLTLTDNTPMEAFYESNIDAAMVIIPDGIALTSGGDDAVPGAKILLSTRTADKVIADSYYCRTDYYNAHKAELEEFVHGLMLAEQELKNIVKNQNIRSDEYNNVIKAAARILLDDESDTNNAEGLYADCTYVGYRGNVNFIDSKYGRNIDILTKEIQAAYIPLGLISAKFPVAKANWDFNKLRVGLSGIDDVEAPRFKAEVVKQVVAKKQAMGTLDQGELFKTEIFFKANQNTFSVDMYESEFKEIVRLAATYGGAIIIVEGHSDPLKYLRKKKAQASNIILTKTKQSAKNLSITRAVAVRNSIMAYAEANGLSLDASQFTVVGHGITQPNSGVDKFGEPIAPPNEEAWLSNMRVVFRIIQIEAEESAFELL